MRKVHLFNSPPPQLTSLRRSTTALRTRLTDSGCPFQRTKTKRDISEGIDPIRGGYQTTSNRGVPLDLGRLLRKDGKASRFPTHQSPPIPPRRKIIMIHPNPSTPTPTLHHQFILSLCHNKTAPTSSTRC
jgi:hypothetical protein